MPTPRRPKAPILIVEDKDSLRAMLRHALEEQGHSVVEAADEAEALRQVRDTRPDLVLSDLRLLSGDGVGVLRGAGPLGHLVPHLEALAAFRELTIERFRTVGSWRQANLARVGALVARAALRRQESRGGHRREDFPERNDLHWKVHCSDCRVQIDE